ncbi:MAG: hypothetical protein HWE16_09105 [Gammaproteobacteria bacterium]|nr:hypothetical protein [Gammaproteobacteria bacterium]
MKDIFVKSLWLVVSLFSLLSFSQASISKDISSEQLSPAHKKPVIEMVMEGRWNQGPVFASVAHKNYMYFGSSGTVRAVKVKKDSSGKAIDWQEVSSLPTDGVIRDMLVHGKTLYIADGAGWLRLIDISKPKKMKYLSGFDLKRKIRGIAYHDDKIYLAAEWGGIHILDVSDKENPVSLSSIKAGYALDVVVENDTAFVAGGQKGLFMVNIKDPREPKLISTFDISGSSAGIDVRKGLLYVVNMDDNEPALSIIDVKDPAKPKKIASETLIYGAERVRVEGSLVYVAGVANDAGLIIFDVEDPYTPKKLGSWWDPTCSESVYIDSGVAYLAHGDQGLEILDVSDPNTPFVTRHFAAAGHVRNLDTKDKLAFLANGYRGLKIVDTSNKSDLKTIAELKTYRALDVDVLGNYAHIADDWAGYKLIDISDPNKPKLVAELDTPGYAEDVFATKQLAFVASGEGGLRIIYLKDGIEPKELSYVELVKGYAYEVDVKGRYAYLAAGKDGLVVVNISNPSHPVVEAVYKTDEQKFEARGIVVRGNLAYLSAGYSGIKILDISDPKNLSEVAAYKTKRSARHMSLEGDLAYVLDLEYVRVLDISNPRLPIERGEFTLPARSAKVHIDSGNIFVAGMESGMMIIDAN